MDAGVNFDLSVVVVVPLFGELAGLGAGGVGLGEEIFGEHRGAPGDVGADTAFYHFGDNIVAEVVHIGHGGDAAGDGLGQGKGGAGAHGTAVQLGLHGENVVVEPGLQVVAAAVAPHQGHGEVGVGVHKTGHEYFPGGVHLTVGALLGPDGTDVGDLPAADEDIAVLQYGARLVHAQNRCVGEESGHVVCLPFVSNRSAPGAPHRVTVFPVSRGSGWRRVPWRPRRRRTPPVRSGAGRGCRRPCWCTGSGPAPACRSERRR